MRSFQMQVTKKEKIEGSDKSQAIPIGEVTVYYPLLRELNIPIDPTKWEKEGKDGKMVESTEAEPEAFPVYADDYVDWVFSSTLAAIKAMARNRLVSGTIELKPGNKIIDNLDDLLATGERSGVALADRRACFAAFKAWLPSLGKPAAFNAGFYDIVSNVKGLPYQSDARKQLVATSIEGFVKTLSEADKARYDRTLVSILENAAQADPLSA